MLLLALATACLAMPAPAAAQDAPPLRVAVHAPSEAQANATIALRVDVLTPTWFTQPPRLPALDLPGVMVTAPSGEGELIREDKDGVSYVGVRYTYLLIAAQPGTLQLPALTVSAKVGPGGNEVSASSAPLAIEVGGGLAGAQGGAAAARGGAGASQGAVSRATGGAAATRMSITQDYVLAPDPLVTGGRITRTITQRAQGVQAMLLQPAPLDEIPHFNRYPLEPQVTTLTDGRGGFVGGQRIDRVEYVAMDAGTFDLPSVTLQWRNTADGALETQTMPGRRVTVAVAPRADVPFSLADDLSRLRQSARWVVPPWAVTAVAILAPLLLLLWVTWPWWRRGARAVREAARRGRARWRSSEPYYWRAWQRESRGEPTALTACYRWLRKCTGMPAMRMAVAPLGAGEQAAAGAALRQAYGPRSGDRSHAGEDRNRLASETRAWRAAWRRHRAPRPAHALPRSLAECSSRPSEPAAQWLPAVAGEAGGSATPTPSKPDLESTA
ncbi:hypothetical protein C7R54_01075 [Achromobacter aloeverae]|uniref:Protein BatD n=2 Tax=Achromobacter aloeverae TaxID=1750518 RepID=A0A4Q1HSG6_9BURK|nr:hypothetical protein C7R54_01075 [Achromobacter aloeverae]